MKKLILAVAAMCAMVLVSSNFASASPRGFGGHGNRGFGSWNRGYDRGGYGHSRSMNRFPQVHRHNAYCGHMGRSGYGYGGSHNNRPGFGLRFGY